MGRLGKKDIYIKLRYIILPELAVSAGFIAIYSLLVYYFYYKWEIIPFRREWIEWWIPLVSIVFLTFLFVYKPVKYIVHLHKKNNDWPFILTLILGASYIFVFIFLMDFIKTFAHHNVRIENITELREIHKSDCIRPMRFHARKSEASVFVHTYMGGKYHNHLNVDVYYAVPVTDKLSDTVNKETHRHWLGIPYYESETNSWTEKKAENFITKVYNQSIKKFENEDLDDFVCLEPVPPSNDRDGFLHAISKTGNKLSGKELIILKPVHRPVSRKARELLHRSVKNYAIINGIFLLVLLFLKVDYNGWKTYLQGPKKLKPKRRHKKMTWKERMETLWMMLKDLWLCWLTGGLIFLYFIFLLVQGVDIIHPYSDQLARWGGLSRELFFRGEYWRLLTSMYIHGGFMHLFYNFTALLWLCLLLHEKFGSKRLAFIYFLSGLTAGLAVILLSENDHRVFIGASGAIFGWLGAMAAILVRYRERLYPEKDMYKMVVIGLGGASLLMGLQAGISNTAHIAGLIAGFVSGWFLARREYLHM
ncbi:MAG: rhomboid family intramembrane serine protease [Chlorobi bacterium]|nr:rhomboid family intramembrane serine protease [Chlorobiota bacterium]